MTGFRAFGFATGSYGLHLGRVSLMSLSGLRARFFRVYSPNDSAYQSDATDRYPRWHAGSSG